MTWQAGDIVSVTGHEFEMNITTETMWSYRINAIIVLQEHFKLDLREDPPLKRPVDIIHYVCRLPRGFGYYRTKYIRAVLIAHECFDLTEYLQYDYIRSSTIEGPIEQCNLCGSFNHPHII